MPSTSRRLRIRDRDDELCAAPPFVASIPRAVIATFTEGALYRRRAVVAGSRCFETMPLAPSLRACANITAPSPSRCSVYRMPAGVLASSFASLACAPQADPRISEARRLPPPSHRNPHASAIKAVIDGEAVWCDGNGLAIFDKLHSRTYAGEVILYAFDLLELHGEDWRPPPLEDRKARLARLLAKSPAGVGYTEHLKRRASRSTAIIPPVGPEALAAGRGGLWPTSKPIPFRKCRHPKKSKRLYSIN